ncbi:MAG: hypothetical protein E7594_05130 [Ruminococcaceae bacterium]|nr:hypothetical protein [Oscillospiraceae bacterium]
MKEKRLTKGYVRPYNAVRLWIIVLLPLFLMTLLFIYMFFALGKVEPIIAIMWLSFCVLCVVSWLIMLIFDKTSMRYCIGTDAVCSRDLLRKHCILRDEQVKQIELCMSVGDVHRYNLHAKAPHMICSDRFYMHDNRISLSYHRKSQVVVRITRKNFPQVQEYLSRMGVSIEFDDYDSMMQTLPYGHLLQRRRSDCTWQQQ